MLLNILSFLLAAAEEADPMAFNAMTVVWSVVVMVGIALLFGILIVVLSQVLAIEEDPRKAEILALLAGANCGGCGYPGCAGLADALIEGKGDISACGPTAKENKAQIANILGLSAGDAEETRAIVACNGGIECRDKFDYQGYGDCVSSQFLAGGAKKCSAGCLGFGSCVGACPFDAIKIDDNGVAHVNEALCTGCGACIRTCPKNVIVRIPVSAKVYPACHTQCKGKEVMDACKNGCISCSKCVKECPSGAIVLENNVPVVDYKKCTACYACVASCPRKVFKKI